MPKPLVNNKITYQSLLGRVIQHDLFLDQGVKVSDSPTFANLQLTGDSTIEGNLYVLGNTTILDTNTIEFEDNILLLNRLETGSGVTLNQAGFEIQRGTLENYRIVYNETHGTVKIGPISNMQSVATREDTPLPNGVMTWNDTTKRLDSSNTISIDLSLTSTTNSTSSSTGSLTVAGGIGVEQDIQMDGKLYLRGSDNANKSVMWTDSSTNSLHVTSTQDIFLTPFNKVQIPFNKTLTFGSSDQSISANAFTNDLEVKGRGNIFFQLDANKRISVPNQIPITFSTQFEKVYADSSSNMVVEGSQDIHFIPGVNKKVFIPVSTPLAFSNSNQQISANLNNDLSIVAGNNILLIPGTSLDVRIPTDSGMKFGDSGTQRIVANSNNDLSILASGNINLTSSTKINIPANVPLTLGGNAQYIQSSSSGHMQIAAQTTNFVNAQIILDNTQDATSGTTGSLYTHGGIAAQKTVYSETAVIVDSDNDNALLIRNNTSRNTFLVRNSSSGSVEVNAGNGTSSQPTMQLTSTSVVNAGSLIQLTTANDSTPGYNIGRGTSTANDGRTFTVNLPTYSDYNELGARPKFAVTTNDYTTELFSIETDTGNLSSAGILGLTNTQDSTNATTASFVIYGGLGVVKTIYTNGRYIAETSSTEAILIKDATLQNVYTLDTVNKQAQYDASLVVNMTTGQALNVNDSLIVDSDNRVVSSSYRTVVSSSDDSTDTSTGALVVSGGMSVNKKLRVADTAYLTNGLDMGSTRITNLTNPVSSQDAATKAYVDLIKQGLFVKDSVKAATEIAGTLATDFQPGSVIDGYTLQTGDRILIKNQLDSIENGIYVVQASGAPLRANDLAIGMIGAGVFCFVQTGLVNGTLGWVCNSSPGVDIVGTHGLSFTQFTGLGQVTAGAGLSKNFNQIYVNVDDNSIEISSDILRIKSSAIGTGLTGGSGLPIQTLSDQSHVTKVGTIDSGTWQASTLQVPYGGTGHTQFSSGSILFGNGSNALNTANKLYFDAGQTRLGLGTNMPTEMLHLQGTDSTVILLNANSDGNSSSAKPEVRFAHSGVNRASIAFSRNYNEYANNIHANALVLANNDTGVDSVIQLATQQQSRVTILANGNVGINTSVPSSQLEVIGTFSTSGLNRFVNTTNATGVTNGAVVVSGGVGISKDLRVGGYARIYNTEPTNDYNSGALIVDGGLSVKSNQNATNIGNGGALNVAGGASIGGDLWVGGEINGSGSSSSTFAYLTLTATDEAINLTSGALVTFGGITIQATTNSTSITNGGSLLVAGGASIGYDMYIGGSEYLYGAQHNFSAYDNLLNIYDATSYNQRWSIDRNTVTNNFSISFYDETGSFVEESMSINSTTGIITLSNNTQSLTPTVASLVLAGGISVLSTANATSLTSGGGITSLGGHSILQNLLVGGDTHLYSTTQNSGLTNGALVVSGGAAIAKNTSIGGTLQVGGDVTFTESVAYKGSGLLDVISNTSGTSMWYYFGQINTNVTAYTEIELSYGTTAPNISSIKFIASINGTNASFSHTQSGNLHFSDQDKVSCYVFNDSGDFHLFAQCPQDTTTFVRVIGQDGTAFNIVAEGSGTEPNGLSSGYVNTWVQEYNTLQESNLSTSVGDLTVEGTRFKVADNMVIVGYNNQNTVSSRDIGTAYQRYQKSNNSGVGDIVAQTPVLVDTLPNQSTATTTQLIFSNSASSANDYYVGWWVKVATGLNTDQVRKIVAYNGSLRVAELESPWDTTNPSSGDIVNVYNAPYVITYFDEDTDKFKFAMASIDLSNNIQHHNDCDVQVKNLYVTDTTASTSSTVGGIFTLGGISIHNTTNSDSSTNGGSLTTIGGAAIRKKLYVGDNIAVGTSAFQPQTSLHINQVSSTIRLENTNGSFSYIDFQETGSTIRFGAVRSGSMLHLTSSTSNDTPDNATKALTVTSNGYVGINTTTNINSPLTLPSNNFISSSTKDGFIGMIAANTNSTSSTDGAKIIVYGNDDMSNGGNVQLHTGTSGSVQVFSQGTERLRVASSGVTNLYNTTTSQSSTQGAFVVSGGISISGTENSQSPTRGGALTVAGGASISKDIFIGGNLYITGNLNASGSVLTPVMSFSNTDSCTVTAHGNVNLINVSSEATLSFYVEVTPLAASQNCQFQFSLPDRITNIVNRGELVATCTGYTDDSSIIPLFNCICVGSSGSTRGLVKFQSVSTGIHYLTILCRYSRV